MGALTCPERAPLLRALRKFLALGEESSAVPGGTAFVR